MRLKNFLNTIFVAALLALPTMGAAQTILTVATSEQSATYTLEDLLALPQTHRCDQKRLCGYRSNVPRTALARGAGASRMSRTDATLKMVALNDFSSNVPARRCL